MKMSLFGKEITLKDHQCSLNGEPGKPRKQSINIYVVMTNACNAKCQFCCNEGNRGKIIPFNVEKFKNIITAVNAIIPINRLSFTGGEPTLNCKNGILEECVKAVKGIDSEIFTIINTNGTNLAYLDGIAEYFDSIALSRHFFTDEKNMEIFGTTDIATERDIKRFKHKEKIHISCNIQKGFIDNPKKIIAFLEHVSSMGVSDVGFVTLMKVNEYSKEHFVDFADIDFNLKRMFTTKEWNYETYCRCRNYIYVPMQGVPFVRIYSRYYCDPTFSASTLVYDGENLRVGFGGDIII